MSLDSKSTINLIIRGQTPLVLRRLIKDGTIEPKIFSYIKKRLTLCFSRRLKKAVTLFSMFFVFGFGCKKLINVGPPTNSITTSSVFGDSSDASSAILGLYSKLLNTNAALQFGDGACSIYLGLSADELIPYNAGNPNLNQIYINTIVNNNSIVYGQFWLTAYSTIYKANACIEGLNNSTTISKTAINQFIGEATFIRDLCYFYLINIFGSVPYVTDANAWQQTAVSSRTTPSVIYQQIIGDLKNCQGWLRSDFSISGGERTRATQEAATALLARVYLYNEDWNDALTQATSIINNGKFSLIQSSLAGVFSPNSSEAILQWALNTSYYPGNATAEGYSILPASTVSPPSFYLSSQLLNAFESGDYRRLAWVDSTVISGLHYYYPFKYTIGPGNHTNGAAAPQYYMVLRLAEQYLIRAEAEANLGDLSDAINDINIIRARAGLGNLSNSMSSSQIIGAIMQERRVEMFAEWGHRWLDLKRTGAIDSVMNLATPKKNGGGVWNTDQKLYPIPLTELQADPNLGQNVGY